MSAILFDLDGTLLRLEVDIEEVRMRLGAMFAPLGVTAPFRPILTRIPAAAREAAARGAGDEAALRAAGFAILTDWELRGAASARPRDGAPAVLAALAERGVKLGLVTNNSRACVPVALAAAGIDLALFGALASRDDVPLPKPDPAGILQVAAALGVTDNAAGWYVGDHQIDIDAGRSARERLPGLRLAALKGSLAPGASFQGADRVLATLDEVLSLL